MYKNRYWWLFAQWPVHVKPLPGSLCCLLPTLMAAYRPDSALHLTTAHTKPGFWSWQAERKSHRPTSHQHSTLMDTASTKQLHFHTFFPLSFISTMSTLWVFVVLSVLSGRQLAPYTRFWRTAALTLEGHADLLIAKIMTDLTFLIGMQIIYSVLICRLYCTDKWIDRAQFSPSTWICMQLQVIDIKE